jgi:hypothetical protein
MIQPGNITLSDIPGAPSGFVNVAGARNGLTQDTAKFIVLGQDVGAAGSPGKLISDREIPFNGHQLSIGVQADGANLSTLLIIGARATNYIDQFGNAVLQILPSSNVTTVGDPGQFYTNWGVAQTYNYTNAAGSGNQNDFASNSAWAPTAGAISFAAFRNVSNTQASGGSGDFIGFDDGPVLIVTGGTGKARGFYHHPTLVSIPVAQHVAMENTTGDVLLCSTTSGGAGTQGRVSIRNGTGRPTAILHLGAGVAAASGAPLKFTAGTLLTTPENGAMEFDGTHLYITIGGVRTTIV